LSVSTDEFNWLIVSVEKNITSYWETNIFKLWKRFILCFFVAYSKWA